jgi:tRNA1(Val) A37 N6-methylase TrmN6
VVFPLWPGGKDGKPAKRVIVSGVKGSAAPPSLVPGLTLHRSDGAFTPEADAVMRSGHALFG